MLFDLRSRGRRRTVQGVYLGLAILMGGGLVLFGVGAGNGLGGLLNAFTGNGSSSGQKQVVSQQEKAALRQTRQSPSNPAGWAALVQARWTSAGQGNNFNTNTGDITNHLGRFYINRHNKAINVMFLDGHAETVPLKNIPTLKWSNQF